MLSRCFTAVLLASLVLASSVPAQNKGAEKEGGKAVSLFNGKDLSGWKGDMEYWSVEDGAITGRTTPENLLSYNTFLVWDGGAPRDFELTLRYRIVGGNSGVQYRSRVIDEDKYIVSGYQADIDSSPMYSGMVYEEKARTILAERGQRVKIAPDGSKMVTDIGDKDDLQAAIKNEDWNDYTIIAEGNHIKQLINGRLMSELFDMQADKAAKSGVIALQLHQGDKPMTIQFKDIRLRELN